MSKLLLRLLSAAVFPAALMIVAKLLGTYFANQFFDLGWSISNNQEGIFSVQVVYPSLEAAVKSNSFSNLFMLTSILIGNAFLIFQGYFLHTSHQNPKVLVKLVRFDFVAWLTDSPQLFPRMAVWLSFLWVVSIIIITQSLQGMTYEWVAIIAFLSSLFTTWLCLRDIEQEIKNILPEKSTLKNGWA